MAELINCTESSCFFTGLFALNLERTSAYFYYFSGDHRGSFYLTLSLLHSLFIRFHNVIATGLGEVNPSWSDQQLFLESRRLLTAFYQNFIYSEWLPLFLGDKFVNERNLSCSAKKGVCGQYDPTLDASSTNEFSTAAFRMFHGNAPYKVNIYNPGELTV